VAQFPNRRRGASRTPWRGGTSARRWVAKLLARNANACATFAAHSRINRNGEIGDQQVYQNVRLIGNQDTLQVKSPSATTVARSYFKNSYVEGDTDFIFGRGTAVFDGCTITYVSSRKTNSTHISPSTESAHPFGFLIVNSKIVGDPGMPTGTAYLGRAWDDSSGTAPNGQAVIRDTEIGAHVNVTTPWTLAATSSRAFSASGNRLYEYQNTGPGSAGAPADGGTVVDAAMDEPAQHDGGGSATDGAAAGQ